MMNWLRHNPMIERKKVEPGATFSLLENHWKQATEVMEKYEDSEGALAVISHLSQMISFLRLARGEESEQSCKLFWLQNRCSEKVIKWLHDLQLNGIQLPDSTDERLVQMLQSLCELASKDEELLGYVKNSNDVSPESWDGACSLASLLLEYSLRSDQKLGTTARDSFILLIQLASRYAGLEKCLSQETGLGLTNVVISGLSACFSQLPTFIQGTAEQLSPFVVQLKFVDSVTHAAPYPVASTIAECFSNAFLVAVIQPALTQDEESPSLRQQHDHFVTSLHEEIANVTYYLQIVCEYLTHEKLLRNLFMFIMSRLLPTLIQRINHRSTAVTVSTLSLFNVLLDLYCEDFWYETVLKYLIPQNHLMVSQRGNSLPEIDFHESAIRYLSLLPVTVADALGADLLTNHYVQYLSKESCRLSTVNNLVISKQPYLSQAEECDRPASSNKERTNATTKIKLFPLWQLNYDGEDKNVPLSWDINFTAKAAATTHLELTNGSEAEAFSSCESATQDKIEDITSTAGKTVKQKFTTINLQHSTEELDLMDSAEQTNGNEIHNENVKLPLIHPLSRMIPETNVSDGYSSMESSPTTETSSFGPFLDTLLLHLNGWTRLHPHTILMVTEVLSTLASSRIPLITSLLLDTGLILQPSYQSFTLLLNRIRAELDLHLKANTALIVEVWSSMNYLKDSQQRRNSRSSSSVATLNNDISSSSFSDNFADNIRKKISGSGSIAAAFSQVFQRKGPSSSAIGNEMAQSESLHSIGSQSYRYVNRNTPAAFKDHLDANKVMAQRAIFFTHWLLELGAIAQQLSWK